MVVSTHKANHFKGAQAVTAIVVRFTGQLKNWWDNFLDPDARSQILNHTYIKTKGNGTTKEDEDGPEMLIHTITLHFISNPKKEQAASKTILINLRCPALSDRRWYKNVFLTNVLKREDGTQDF